MSMATDHQGRRFPNAVRYLRDEIEPLFGNDFHYDPIQLANFLDRNNGAASFSQDIAARANANGHVLGDGPRDHYSQQYGEAFSKDSSRYRGIVRRMGHGVASRSTRLMGGALAAVGGLIGLAYTSGANYYEPTWVHNIFGNYVYDNVLPSLKTAVLHAKDVGIGAGVGYGVGVAIQKAAARIFRRNRP